MTNRIRKPALFKCRRQFSEILAQQCQETGHPGLLAIGWRAYDFTAIPHCGPEVVNCFRLTEYGPEDGRPADTRTVTVLRSGQEDCDCQDFVYVAGPLGHRCKHLHALADCGLIPLPAASAEQIASESFDPFA